MKVIGKDNAKVIAAKKISFNHWQIRSIKFSSTTNLKEQIFLVIQLMQLLQNLKHYKNKNVKYGKALTDIASSAFKK
jgi:hypothetical protein